MKIMIIAAFNIYKECGGKITIFERAYSISEKVERDSK
jgi:hypothetical protein